MGKRKGIRSRCTGLVRNILVAITVPWREIFINSVDGSWIAHPFDGLPVGHEVNVWLLANVVDKTLKWAEN